MQAPPTPEVSATTAGLEKPKFDWAFETLGDPSLDRMFFAAQEFAVALEFDAVNKHWLSLLGTSGAGKTHLARKISEFFRTYMLNELIPGQDLNRTRYHMKGGFLSWRKLCQQMRNGDYSAFQAACEDYFVVIDDIGSGHETSFVTSKLDELFDARQKKWTVVTGNLSLGDIQKIDARLASRMLRDGSVVVDVSVTDYNLREKTTSKA